MIISAIFTDSGSPQTGLSATCIIRDLEDTATAISALSSTMVEVGTGCYSATFNPTRAKLYYVRCDGGSGITSGWERYQYKVISVDKVGVAETYDL